jgi:CheY-like chemotaxis protein
MEQVILNLAVNARDAMPDGGQLTFETRNVELGDAIARANNLKPGRYIEFLVRDTGQGMALNVQTHLFEPFFTTKPAGKGTGLGLFTVYGIVKQYNGHITFTSQPNRGTTFRIFLPRVDSTQALVAAPAEIDPVQRGQETILLVEDDLAVCELIRAVLAAHGYNVATAVRPGDAEKLFDKIGSRVDLLVSDIVMPDISGTELAKRLVARNPTMKVIFMSGYIGDAIVRSGIREKDVGFLQKPFAPMILVRKIREVLDGTRVREG